MNKDLAIEILKQASLETTTGACEHCPRKDKNKTCIGCLDEAKEKTLLEIERLQDRIDKTLDYIEVVQYNESYGVREKDLLELIDILKGE